MSLCKFCQRDGLLFVRDLDSDGYLVLACACVHGQRWRVKWQLRAYVANLLPPPIAFGRIEEFFNEKEQQSLSPTSRDHAVKDGREYVAVR